MAEAKFDFTQQGFLKFLSENDSKHPDLVKAARVAKQMLLQIVAEEEERQAKILAEKKAKFANYRARARVYNKDYHVEFGLSSFVVRESARWIGDYNVIEASSDDENSEAVRSFANSGMLTRMEVLVPTETFKAAFHLECLGHFSDFQRQTQLEAIPFVLDKRLPLETAPNFFKFTLVGSLKQTKKDF